MTTIPFRKRLMIAITDTIRAVTPANGYTHDLSDFDPGDGTPMARVYRGRAWFGESDPLPMVSILEAASPADPVADEPEYTPASEYEVILLVQGWAQDDKLNPTDPAYDLMCDVRKALAAERSRMAPLAVTGGRHIKDPFCLWSQGAKNRIIDIKVGPGVVRPADDVSAKAYFWLTLKVQLVDHADAPFS